MRPIAVTFKRKPDRVNSNVDKTVVLHVLGLEVLSDTNAFLAPVVLSRATEEDVARLRADPNVERVEYTDGKVSPHGWLSEYTLSSLSSNRATLQQFPPQWPYNTASLAPGVPNWGVSRIGPQPLWPQVGDRIGVVHLDTGVDITHPYLASSISGGINFTDEGEQQDFSDLHWHGTHTVGCVIQCAGSAASVFSIKVLTSQGSGQWGWIIAALSYVLFHRAEHNWRIVTMSLGGSEAPEALRLVIEECRRQGLIVLASAGNTSGPVEAPGKWSLAVSAIDWLDTLANFSSRGPELFTTAPGVRIPSTVPTSYNATGWAFASGTSMACPLVAGVAALLLSVRVPKLEHLLEAVTVTAELQELPATYGRGLFKPVYAAKVLLN